MKEQKPVALWKGIVGTAISGTVLSILVPIEIVLVSHIEKVELWLLLTITLCSCVCFFSLIVSLYNLITTSNYRKEHREIVEERKPKQENNDEKTELLHRLLAEGKITIEEYDKLRNK